MSWKARTKAVLVLCDALATAVAVWATVHVWVSCGARTGGVLDLNYASIAMLTVLGWVLSLGIGGSRSSRVLGAGLEEYRRVVSASIWFFGAAAIASYVFKMSVSRGLFVTALPAGTFLLLVGRWLMRRVLGLVRHHGVAMVPALIVGNTAQVGELLHTLEKNVGAGYQAAGVCLLDGGDGSAVPAGVTCHAPAALVTAATSGDYGAVIVGDGLGASAVRNLAWCMESSTTELMFLPRLMDVAGPRIRVSDVEGLSLVSVDLPRFSGWRLWLKRIFDLGFSVMALAVSGPVFLVVAMLIKADDGGPVFFRQQRIGLRGKPITVHKFRTMCVDAESKIGALIAAGGGKALLFKMEDDPRVTRIGKILRKYSIDELPQFWSVLRGGMSVVGPRPQVSREVSEYTKAHYRRLLIKPGITGLWQINGRSELSMEESIRLDLKYVENWSLIGDIMIILKTVRVLLRPSGAY